MLSQIVIMAIATLVPVGREQWDGPDLFDSLDLGRYEFRSEGTIKQRGGVARAEIITAASVWGDLSYGRKEGRLLRVTAGTAEPAVFGFEVPCAGSSGHTHHAFFRASGIDFKGYHGMNVGPEYDGSRALVYVDRDAGDPARQVELWTPWTFWLNACEHSEECGDGVIHDVWIRLEPAASICLDRLFLRQDWDEREVDVFRPHYR
jgi:hypothetical protein